jgi:hypothetical protein
MNFPGEKGSTVGLERFLILALIAGLGVAVTLWQNEAHRTLASYVTRNGETMLVDPVPEDYRGDEEVKKFAQNCFKQTRNWDWQTPTAKKAGSVSEGVRVDVLLGMHCYAANINQPTLTQWEKNRVYNTVQQEKVKSSFVSYEPLIVSTGKPFKVWIRGEIRREYTAKGYAEFIPYAIEYTIQVVQRDPKKFLNAAGLLIVEERDLSTLEMKGYEKELNKK